MKVDPDAPAMLYTSRLGVGVVTGLAVDPSGQAYVTGKLPAEESEFPTTPGAFQATGGLGFVAKLAADSGEVIYATRLNAEPAGIAVDAEGNAYVTGTAREGFTATDRTVKPRIGALRCSDTHGTVFFACRDAFVLKLSPDGSSLVYSTFLGGSLDDQGNDIAVDAEGNAYVVGDTVSDDFPRTWGAFGPEFGGIVRFGPFVWGDAFLAKLDPTGGRLIYSTYVGGSEADFGTAVAVDADQKVAVVGATGSRDFPVTANAFQTVFRGARQQPSERGNGFVVKLDAAGQGVYATYFGAQGREQLFDVALGPEGNTYFTGSGFLEPILDGVEPSPCSSFLYAVGLDGEGKVLGSMRLSQQDMGGFGTLAVTQPGIVHLASVGRVTGSGLRTFATTPDALQHSGRGYLGIFDLFQPASIKADCLLNAASLEVGRWDSQHTVVAPGEIVTVFGEGFASEPLSAKVDASGKLTTELGGVRLLIEGISAPLLYVDHRQINAIVPTTLVEGASTMETWRGDDVAGPFGVEVVDSVAGVFTQDPGGRAIHMTGFLVSPTRAGAALKTAAGRGLSVS